MAYDLDPMMTRVVTLTERVSRCEEKIAANDKWQGDQNGHIRDTMVAVQELKDEAINEVKETAILVQNLRVESVKGVADLQRQTTQQFWWLVGIFLTFSVGLGGTSFWLLVNHVITR